MHPTVSSLVRNNHPLVKAPFSVERLSLKDEIDLFWSIYNALPDRSPRLERTKTATRNLWGRRNHKLLPPRKAFQTTVDYYEAFLPLYQAKHRFLAFYQPDSYFRGIRKVLATILPDRLF